MELDELRSRIARTHGDYQAARYSQVLERLTPMLEGIDSTYRAANRPTTKSWPLGTSRRTSSPPSATEMGDAAEAVRLAADLDTGNFPEGLVSRRAQVHLDLAWAQAQRKRDAEATLHLMEAERTAPEAVRYNVIVRELVREMLNRGTRSQTTALTQLATRAGILD